jgi:hypothetical protein
MLRLLSFGQTLVLIVVAVVGLSGCGADEGDPYASAKGKWDSPPTDQELQDLRHRAAMTQQDH